MKQSFLRIGTFGDEVYCILQSGLIINKETMKPIVCGKCGDNFLYCETENVKTELALRITKKFCPDCGKIN